LLRIRLRRTGKKKQASYRVVVADQRAPRDGAFVEIVGHYNPLTEPRTIEFNEERVKHWLSVGAKPSDTVHRLLNAEGIWDAKPAERVTKPSRAEREAAAAAAVAEEEAATAAAAAAAEAASSDDESSGGDSEESSSD
jgi:small subunit ribosomal protein S16